MRDATKPNRAERREAARTELLARRASRTWPEVLTYRAACARVEELKRTKPRAWWPAVWLREDTCP